MSSYMDEIEPVQLPAAVMSDLLERSEGLAKALSEMIAPVEEAITKGRQAMLDEGMILPVAQVEPTPMVAVDGGVAVEQTYAADLVCAVAMAACGLAGGSFGDGQAGTSLAYHDAFLRPYRHSSEVPTLARAVMMALEAKANTSLSSAPIRIMDGSHATPLLKLGLGLASSDEIASLVVEIATEYETLDRLRAMWADPHVIAMPKSESSDSLARTLKDITGIEIGASDRIVAALLLAPGERLRPELSLAPPTSWAERTERAPKEARLLAKALDDAARPLSEPGLLLSYVKPHSAATALRVETKAEAGEEWAAQVAAAVSAETLGPHLQEPFAQHMADRLAKGVSIGASASIAAAITSLSTHEGGRYVEYVGRSYRTMTKGKQ